MEIDGAWFAWNEDDGVYRYDPHHKEARDDGYVLVGRFAPTGAASESAALFDFVRQLSLPPLAAEAPRQRGGD